MITVKDIEQPYMSKTNEKRCIKNVTFNVSENEIFGLINKDPLSRKTLSQCLNLVEQPQTGHITIDNKITSELSGKALKIVREQIGIASHQESFLLTKTVFENICLPLAFTKSSKQSMEHVTSSMLSLVGLQDKENCFLNELNIGEKRRLALARALISKPRILICDEITAGLDPRTTHSIIKLIKQVYMELGLTIIIMTYEINVIKALCKRVAVMHQDQIIEHTDTLKFFTNPNSAPAQELIKISSRLDLPLAFRKKIKSQKFENSHPIIRIAFLHCSTPELYFSHIIEEFQIKLNIIQAHQEKIQKQLLNVMSLELRGSDEDINSSIAYLSANKLYSEVLGYVA